MAKAVLKLFERPSIDWLIALVCTAGSTWLLLRFAHIPGDASVADAMSAAAGVFGTMSGFLSAALLFTAGIENATMRAIHAEFGKQLNDSLLGATFVLLIAAAGSVVCAMYANGLVARVAVLYLAVLASLKLLRAGIVIRGALASVVAAASAPAPGAEQTPVD